MILAARIFQTGLLRGGRSKNLMFLSLSFARFSCFGEKYTALALPEEKGFLRTVKLSGIKEEEVGRALEFQLEEHIPLSAADAVFNYTISKREKDHLDVVLYAFPKITVESYLDVFSKAGALPVYIESELNASVEKT